MNQRQALTELEKTLKQWTSTPVGRRHFLMSIGVLLAACASTEQHRGREGDNSGQDTELSIADEKKMTAEVLPQMRKDYPPLNSPEVQNYISNLGRKLVTANRLEGNPYNYSFTVVDVDYVNAFALPAGTVFVTTPLLAMAENEAELAGVVGHEIGHIKARHTAERMEKAKKEQSKSAWFGAGGGILGATLGYGLGKLMCKSGDNECMQKSVLYGAAAGAAGGLLIQKYGFMANSREDEMEADRVGFRVATGGNYDKVACGTFYEKLLKMEQAAKSQQQPLISSVADAMSTHPPSQERVQQMKEMASQLSQSGNTIINTGEFDRIKKTAKAIIAAKPKKQG